MNLEWYYFGDAACLTSGSYDGGTFVKKLVDDPNGPGAAVDAPLPPDEDPVEKRLASLFKKLSDKHEGDEAPLLGWIRKAVKATNRAYFPWQGAPIDDLDVRIVRGFPLGREREYLLTPTTLYVSWLHFAAARRKGVRLGLHLARKNRVVPSLDEVDYEDGHHMWVDAALDAGDVLGRIPHASRFDPIRALETMAATRERDGRPDVTPSGLPDETRAEWTDGIPDVAPLSLGRFDMEIKPGLPRSKSYVSSDGTTLTFVLGLKDPVPVEGGEDEEAEALYCPWPCGALQNCRS